MSEQTGDKPMAMPVPAQRAVADRMVQLLRQAGMTVNVAETQDGLNLALAFNAPPEFDADSFGTDEPGNAALWWGLKDLVERAD